MDNGYAERFADALITEIKSAMARKGLSSRGLGRLIGESSQYMSMRLDGGNPRTGTRVVLTTRDLAAIAAALEMDLRALVEEAQSIATSPRLDS